MASSPGNQENSLVSVDFPQLDPVLDVHSMKLREKKSRHCDKECYLGENINEICWNMRYDDII